MCVFNLHKKIKNITSSKRHRRIQFVDDKGNQIVETNSKLSTWKSYIEKLFHSDRALDHQAKSAESGPIITINEVKLAIKRAKSGKVVGLDEIPSEIIKILEEETIQLMTAWFNKIYETGTIPNDWLRSTFITIPKKTNAKKCENFRTINLMSHILKVFLRVIHQRIYNKLEEEISNMQFGFRKGLGTREALYGIQVLIQRCRDIAFL